MAENTEEKSFFKRIFKTIIGSPESPTSEKQEEVGPYGPKTEEPVDQKFAKNYTQNGGHFIYCSSFEEATSNLKNVFLELGLEKIYCHDNQLLELLPLAGMANATVEKAINADAFFTNSEFLIAHDGGIMMSSNQFKGFKQNELPSHYIIIGRTSKIVDKLSDAMTGIKDIYKGDIPTSITTLKGPDSDCSTQESNKEMRKTLFLLLLEDAK